MTSSQFDPGSTSVRPQKPWISPFYGLMNGPGLKTLYSTRNFAARQHKVLFFCFKGKDIKTWNICLTWQCKYSRINARCTKRKNAKYVINFLLNRTMYIMSYKKAVIERGILKNWFIGIPITYRSHYICMETIYCYHNSVLSQMGVPLSYPHANNQ